MYVKCPYRSRWRTGKGILRVFLRVWVQSMDLYEHLGKVYSSARPPRKTVRMKGVWWR